MNKINKFFIIRNLLIRSFTMILIAGMTIFSTGCYENIEIDKKLSVPQEVSEQADTVSDTDYQGIDSLGESIVEESAEDRDEAQDYSFAPSLAYPEVDGLHVTGTPVEIDIDSYRLRITGLVENEMELTFDEIKNMPPEKVFAVLDCPGFFVDKGDWTGVKITDLLNMAGLKQEAKTIRFIEEGGGYTREISLEKINSNENGFLVAYLFNEKEFPVVHGFPLRIVAKGESGSLWVKWLGTIEVL